ncbi:hypothetical protein PV04_07778 [Phialophora macrospora]|uniref:Uncharacterized protein n=1 Tax=Phialophora macrospora TaxID=1851006 RepID=A0A0D2FC32_9EURO|nr:hypothetical protein PV04_07778 [Phialophora macrospora]
MNAVVAARNYVGPGNHPSHDSCRHLSDASSAIAAGSGTLAAIGTTYVLPAVGFCAAGVKSGSIAAGVQSAIYGGSVPAGSMFATLQSWGATGALAGTLGVAAVPVGIVVAGGTYLAGKALRGA